MILNEAENSPETPAPLKKWEAPVCEDLDKLPIEGGPAVFVSETLTSHVS